MAQDRKHRGAPRYDDLESAPAHEYRVFRKWVLGLGAVVLLGRAMHVW